MKPEGMENTMNKEVVVTMINVGVGIGVDVAISTIIYLKRLEMIVTSRKHVKLPLKRLLVILPVTKKVIHLLLPEQM